MVSIASPRDVLQGVRDSDWSAIQEISRRRRSPRKLTPLASPRRRFGRRLCHLFERLDEFGEVFLVDVADGNEAHARVRPAGDMIAVDRLDPPRPVARARIVARKLGDGDEMFAVAIDERRRRNPVDDRDASACEREPFGARSTIVGADRGAAGEPRLDRMPVGGGDVERLACDLRPREIGDEAVRRRPAKRSGL